MITRSLRQFIACALFATLSTVAQADVVDQEHVPNPAEIGYVVAWGLGADRPWTAQSFTAGLDGRLTAVDLAIARYSAAHQDLRLQVHEINDATLGALLGAATVPFAALPVGFPAPGADPVGVHIDLSSLDIHVAAGSTYALAVTTTDQYQSVEEFTFWLASLAPGDHYPGGQSLFRWGPTLESGHFMFQLDTLRPNIDLGFRTYVSAVPEVPSVQLAALGLLLLAGRASRLSRRRT